MAELIVGPIIDMLIKICFENLQDHLKRHTGMKKKLESLRDNHSKIQAVVSAASEADIKDQNPALNNWIWQLRDAIDEADDLLDEFLYMQHEEGLAKNKEKMKARSFSTFLLEETCKIRKVGEGFFKTDSNLKRLGEGFFKTDSNLKRLEEVVQKLDKILSEVSPFLYLLNDAKQMQQVQDHELLKARTEGSFPKSTLIGRDKDKENVIQWLRKPDETDITTNNLYKNISLLSIVGHGGMGKTSLLQHIYHQDEMTKEFDLKIWVCVSNNFDIQKVIADMSESPLDNINALQEKLKSKVKSKKFLLVLDDIWEDDWNINKWATVLAPLAYGSLGSKILITTRMDSVAKMISEVIEKKIEKFTLEGLEEEECLQLLKRHAFANVKNQDEYKKLEFIAGELVKKLFGSPLVAKVIGGVLNKNLDERHWTNVLNSAWGRNEILPILKLSYAFLPKELRNCFTFCSIFPQDHKFDKGDLVRMWIAVGFIQPCDIQDGEDLEDVGGRYFDLLVQKSFFDKGYSKYYKMHDLLHAVARSISAQECFRFEGDQKLVPRVPETIRHLSVDNSNVEVLRNLGNFKNLRTLWITYSKIIDIEDFDDMLIEIFKQTRSIRLLYIDNYYPKLIPETIGYLMHLRYLRLNFGYLTQFPKPLCNLYHLQHIIHSGYSSSRLHDFFPRDMSNLSNLRHTNFDSLKFPGIGKLKFLQGPIEFCVKNEIGYRIGELEHLNGLRILKIKCLENVRDAEEAYNAKLCDKRKLTKLSLKWAPEYERKNIADPERVLDNLRPHNDLKVLKISDYMGVKSVIWMVEANWIENLEQIELHGCLEWQNLPPFGQLLFLKSLSLQNMSKAERFDGAVKAEDGCFFPCLTELTLKDCPNLQELPYLPPKLKKLEITNTGWKTLNCRNITKFIALETLKVRHCSNITYIFLAGEIGMVEIRDCPNLIYFGGHQEVGTIGNIPAPVESLPDLPPSLCELRLHNLDNLDCLPSCLPTLSSLKHLYITEVPKLRELPDLPPSLHSLSLHNLDNLDCLPSCLPTLSSLRFLSITEVPNLRELPDLPPSLHSLSLQNLDNLDCLPSCLPTLSSLECLSIIEVLNLQELPDLPSSLMVKHVSLGG